MKQVAQPPTVHSVSTGLDVLERSHFAILRGKRVALLAHPASVNRHCVHILDLLLAADIKPVKLFGPEHGIFGDAQDMAHVTDSVDPRTGIPIRSIYGTTRESLFLNPQDLHDVDILVCDLQDVGSRFYTFAYSIAFAMRACAHTGVECMVLDRPNPIDAVHVEGNTVQPGFYSFVGEYPLAIRHGMTMGELCQWFVHHDQLFSPSSSRINKPLQLHIQWMEHYHRSMHFEQTGLPWILPSPNMPTPSTALVYPGSCLIEGTNLSEGRGTTRPFEIVGAPYITNAHRFAEQLTSLNLPGCNVRPCYFRPTFQKHAGQLCGGVHIHVSDHTSFLPLRTGNALIWAAAQWPGFTWRTETYEYENDRLAMDLLWGVEWPRKTIEK